MDVRKALRRRATEGGSCRVVVSLTRTVLWLLSLGIFDKTYAQATAGSTEEHSYAAPDLFTAETPLGTYQGMTDQVLMVAHTGSVQHRVGSARLEQARVARRLRGADPSGTAARSCGLATTGGAARGACLWK